MQEKYKAVGVFDSGLGGLTSIRELKKILPDENIIYFGDTGRIPYGTRSFETILQYAEDDMNFLRKFDIKTALVACGTVSAIALDSLKEKYDIPITGAVIPASVTAAGTTKTKSVAVFATQATINRGAFEREIHAVCKDVRVFPVACPMFVPLIEGGYIADDCAVTRMIAEEYIEKLINTDVDTIILGCTHYPIIKTLIKNAAEKLLGREINIIDSGFEAAKAAKQLLSEKGLLNDRKGEGSVRYFVSDETQNFTDIASIFLGEPARDVTKVAL